MEEKLDIVGGFMKICTTTLFFLFLMCSSGLIAENQSWCEPSVDLSDDFPPEIKHQGDLGYCFAFASTSLVENYHCRNNKTHECKPLSVMDAIGQYPNSISILEGVATEIEEADIYNEGGYAKKMLAIIEKNGLCSEKVAPYNKFDNLSQKEAWDRLLDIYQRHPKTSIPLFSHELKKKWKEENLCENSFDGVELVEEALGVLENSSPIEVEHALHQENGRAFLKRALLPKECAKRKRKDNFKIHHLDYRDIDINSPRDVQTAIVKQLNKHRPVAVTMNCKGWNPVCNGGGGHVVVVRGMRKNPENGACELLILNSWGREWQDEHDGGYIESESVIGYIRDIIWLE